MLQASWRTIYRTFGKGLFAILPIAVTLYALYWLGAIFERLLGGIIKLFLPEAWYIPGSGLALGVVVVFLVGTALNAWITQWLYDWFESLIDRIPLVKSIYGSVRDLLGFFAQSSDGQAQQVVVVTFGEGAQRTQLLGFVTREDFERLPDGLGDDALVAVYLPMSYQIGGYTLMVAREAIQPIDMTTEQALRFAVTAGMSTEKKKQ
jgi:uncharacterized membrane protein